MKKQYLILFFVILGLGIIITFPSFANARTLDGYCTMHGGFFNTALLFLQNGRVFSALAFYIFNLIHFPFDSLNFISAIFTNIFLAFTIVKLYTVFQNILDLKEKYKKLVLLIALLTLFYNPLFTEVLILDESFIISLGILLMTLSVCRLLKKQGGIANYFLSLILMILAVLCYQGVAVYFFPLLILLMFTNKEITIFESMKKIGIGILMYGISFISNYCVIKIISSILHRSLSKTIELNIFNSVSVVIGDLMPTSFKYLFGFINVKIYYLITLIIFVLIIYKILKNESKKRNTYFLIILILANIMMPFIPNLFMGDVNYTAARMALTLGCFPSILLLFLIYFDVKFDYVILTLAFIVLIFFSYSINQNTSINIKRYKEDIKYIETINQEIKQYENKSHNKVKEIYIAKDLSVAYYYENFVAHNGANIRLLAVDWAMNCAFPVYTENKYIFKKMSTKDYEKYFKGKNYDEFDKKQLVFDNDKLYLLLY